MGECITTSNTDKLIMVCYTFNFLILPTPIYTISQGTARVTLKWNEAMISLFRPLFPHKLWLAKLGHAARGHLKWKIRGEWPWLDSNLWPIDLKPNILQLNQSIAQHMLYWLTWTISRLPPRANAAALPTLPNRYPEHLGTENRSECLKQYILFNLLQWIHTLSNNIGDKQFVSAG